MTPQQLNEFNTMKRQIEQLSKVIDVPFIEEAKRRIVKPYIESINLDEFLARVSVGNTSGVLKSVDEGGSATYNVAEAFDGSMIIKGTDGTNYKIGYYTV